MRSAKETGCFPYRSKWLCFMELFPNGELIQVSTSGEKYQAFCRALKEESKLLAVWPGKWRSDLFIIDDLEMFGQENEFI